MKKVLFAGLLFVLTCFVTADSLFGWTDRSGKTVEVPDLVGRKESGLDLPEWFVIETEYRYDVGVDAGIVTAQEPVAGSLRKIGNGRDCRIRLTVSMGAEQATVPELSGMDIREAAVLLRAQGLTAEEIATPGGPAGKVLKTDPPAGTGLNAGAVVKIYVCKGEKAETVTVPDLTGLSRTEAMMRIFLTGLRAQTVAEEISELPEGSVIRQSPPAGSEVSPGTAIRITVAKRSGEDQ